MNKKFSAVGGGTLADGPILPNVALIKKMNNFFSAGVGGGGGTLPNPNIAVIPNPTFIFFGGGVTLPNQNVTVTLNLTFDFLEWVRGYIVQPKCHCNPYSNIQFLVPLPQECQAHILHLLPPHLKLTSLGGGGNLFSHK